PRRTPRTASQGPCGASRPRPRIARRARGRPDFGSDERARVPAMRLASSLWIALASTLPIPGCFEDIPTDETGAEPTGTGTQGTGDTSGTADDTADDSSGEAVDVCPEYCGLIQDVCTADRAQYPSEAICLGVCAGLPPGSAEDQLGNSAGCRRFQAVQAAEAPDTFCGAAGPTGDGVCGAQCESFCGLAQALCTGDQA